MDVSIIIVNYNTLELTKNCIDSVFSLTKCISFEVILVDNASVDGSKSFFENDCRIRYIYSNENLGFGKANNLGSRHAKGNYLFFLNSDTYLQNNAIYHIWSDFIKTNNEIGNVACAGGLLLNPGGEIAHSYGRFLGLWRDVMGFTIAPHLIKISKVPKAKLSSSNYNLEKITTDIFDVDYVIGADLMVRREVAERYGLFDPDFFLYCEETEMQYRYMKAGFRRIVTKNAKIVHLEGSSLHSNNYSLKKSGIIIKSHYLYFKKTRTKTGYICYCVLQKIFYALWRMITIPFTQGSLSDKYRHLWMVIKIY